MITLYNEEGTVIARTSDYEFTESDMGESSITATVLLSGVQDFHPDWYVEYNGEKFRLGVRKPTGKKDTSSKKTSYTLVFKSEREDLKRYTFMDFVELGSGNPQPATAKVPLYATLTEFVDRFNLNLQYYLGTRWRMMLPESYVESGNSFSVTFENASLWDVLIQVYEIFGVRWTIQANGEELDIIVGADAVEIEHIFEYGKDNGLVSVERNNELERIITRLRGVGSSTNLPADYFHSGDPDTNSELQSVYFQNLLPSVYRDYVRGYNAGSGTGSWAYNQGVADKQAGKPMSPIDYAKSDNEELWGVSYGAIEANEGIYPTLQGVEKEGLGRVDEVVAVEPVLVDSPEDSTEGTDYRMLGASGSVAARDGSLDTSGIQNCRGESNAVEKYIEATLRITQPYNKCYLLVDVKTNYTPYHSFKPETADHSGAFVVEGTLELFSKSNGSKVASQDCGGSSGSLVLTDLPAGEYRLRYSIKIYAKEDKSPTNNVCNVGYILSGTYTEYTSLGQREGFKETFDIWIKDVWGIERNADESDEDYTYRVWSPLAVSDEMTVMFSDGMLAGEDYEFRIVGASSDSDDLRQVIVNAIHPDTSKSYNGVSSAWRLSVEKSDAELQASGRYLPNSMVQAKAGDHFFFINIKMPYDPYVFDAEERLTAYLDEQLALKDVEYPSFTISPSSIFCKNFAEASKIRAGAKIRVRNAELIGSSYTTLHIQSLTKRYTSGSVNPEWSVTVSDEVVASGNPIETLSGEVAVLNAQAYSSRQAISEAIRQLQSTFLRKDGIFDKSYSPTEFSETVRISDKGIRDAGFVNGDLSGKGFAVYTDGDGNRVVEADVIIGRVGARFNEVVINQTTYTGGKQVFSAAGMVVSAVEQIDGGWRCYFDTKNGTVRNMFKVGDGAFCQRFTDAGPLTYWRRVTAIGSDYIDISSTDALAGSAEPGVGDNIAQLGNDTDTSRQAAFMIDEVRDGGGLVTWYDDISGYTLESKDSVMIGRIDGKTWLKVYGSGYIGTRDESQYVKFENGILSIKGAINAESTIGDLGNIGDILSGVSGLEYLKEALPQNTTISGGLILSSTIALGYKDGDTYKVMSGMSGLYDAEQPGGGIAAWYGGDKAEGVAKSLFRFDGTGYLAGGKISWDDAGNVILDKEIKIGDNETLSSILTALNNINKDYLSKSRGGTVQGDTIFAGKLYMPSTLGAGIYSIVFDAESAVDGEIPTETEGLDKDAMWEELSGSAGSQVIAKEHLPSDVVYGSGLTGYATQSWVQQQGYATQSDLDGRINDLINGAPAAYDTLKEIADVLEGNVDSIGDILTALGGKADKATTLAGYGIKDAYTKTEIDEELAKYVTIATPQTITGAKTFSGDVVLGGGGAKAFLPSTAGAGIYSIVFDAESAVDGEVPTESGIDMAAVWAALGTQGTEQIDASHLSGALASYVTQTALSKGLATKVDKVSGMGLSSNDFTDALMAKLNGIEAGANKYVLPTASSTVLGGVKIGANITISNGVISTHAPYVHPSATERNIEAATGRVLSAIVVNSLGHVTSVSCKALVAADIPNLSWAKITSGKPTTLEGYGITDGVNAVSFSGAGNAVTGASVDKHVLRLERNTTFVDISSEQVISGKKIFSGDAVFGSGSGRLFLPSTAGAGIYSLVFDAESAVDGEVPSAGMDTDAMWEELGGSVSNKVIAIEHIPYIPTSKITGLDNALSGYVSSVTTSGAGNAVTGYAKNGNTLTLVKGSTFLTAVSLATISDLHSSWDAVLKAQKPAWLTTVSLATISDLNSSWDALLKVAPTKYVTRWPTASEVGALTQTGADGRYLRLTGGTMTGAIRLAEGSTADLKGLTVSTGERVLLGYVGDDTYLAQQAGTTRIRSGATNLLHRRNGTDYAILDAYNYTSYTVTRTGGGASGTWGISISGNAASATKSATREMPEGTDLNTLGAAVSTVGFANYYRSGGISVDNAPSDISDAAGLGFITWRIAAGFSAQLLAATSGGNAAGMIFRKLNSGDNTVLRDWAVVLDSLNVDDYALTRSNYTSILDGRYVNVSGDTMTGPLKYISNGNRYLTLSEAGLRWDFSDVTGGHAHNWLRVTESDGSSYAGMGVYGGTDGLNYIYLGGTYTAPWIVLRPSGNVGIGVTSPSYRLHVGGNAYVNGVVYASSSFNLTSNRGRFVFDSSSDATWLQGMAGKRLVIGGFNDTTLPRLDLVAEDTYAKGDFRVGGSLFIPSTSGNNVYSLSFDSSSAVDGETPSGVGLDAEAMWLELGTKDSSKIIDASHIPDISINKVTGLSGAVSTITTANLTASRALVSNASGKVAVSAVTATELGYLDGVTSKIQTQLNNRLPLSGGTMTGDITMSGSSIRIPQSPSESSYDGILNADGHKAILAYYGDNTYTGMMTGTHYLRSGATSLIHRRNGMDYTILDTYNYSSTLDSRYMRIGSSGYPTAYRKVFSLNGTAWSFLGTTTDAPTAYAPTTAGASGYVLQSTGGTPAWAAQNSLVVKGIYERSLGVAVGDTMADLKSALTTQMGSNLNKPGSMGYVSSASVSNIMSNWANDDYKLVAASRTNFLRLDGYGSSTYGVFLVSGYQGSFYRLLKNSSTAWGGPYLILDTGNYASTLDSRYVNISGDTMTGALTLGDSSRLNLVVGGATRTAVYDDGNYTIFGDPDYKACILGSRIIFQNATGSNGLVMEDDTFTFKGNSIWHSGNDGPGSGLNADLLDGYQASSFLLRSGGTMTGNLTLKSMGGTWLGGKTQAPIMTNGASSTNGSTYHPIIWGKTDAGDVWNLGHGAIDQVGFFGFYSERTTNGTDWAHYIKVSDGTVHFNKTVYGTTFSGTLSGNATSATKLQTSCTIWGQSFNGSGNVSGDMTGVGSITGATFSISGSVGQMLLYNNTSKNDKRLTLYPQSNYAAIYNITADGNGVSDLVLGNNSNALYYDASAARWGIGTSSPAYKLDVAGTLRATGQGIFDTIKITDNTSAAHLTFGRSNAFNYISLPGYSSTLAIAPGGDISGAGSALCISNSATYPGYHNGTISLGLSSYRWSNVYSVLGNFSGLVTAGSIAVTDKLYIPSPDGNQRYYIKFE